MAKIRVTIEVLDDQPNNNNNKGKKRRRRRRKRSERRELREEPRQLGSAERPRDRSPAAQRPPEPADMVQMTGFLNKLPQVSGPVGRHTTATWFDPLKEEGPVASFFRRLF